MVKASESIRNQEISKYPIFILHQHDLEIGIPLVEDHTIWKIHASSLEEFVSKQIVEEQKVDSFRTIYKNPDQYFCFFVLSELGANFIFTPIKGSQQE